MLLRISHHVIEHSSKITAMIRIFEMSFESAEHVGVEINCKLKAVRGLRCAGTLNVTLLRLR